VTSGDSSESIIGQTLDGKYHVDALIGRGGMGAVYKAQHLGTGRPVAVKTILPRLVKNPELLERFRREARAAGSLRHPNIVDVTDFGVAKTGGDSIAYLVMEYLEGSTLRELIDESGALPVEIVVDIVEQVALALDTAHRIGIVHRDLKPDNIWLVPDARGGHVVRILDFGIAKLREEEAPRSSGSMIPVRGPAPDEETVLRPAADDATLVRTGEAEAATMERTAGGAAPAPGPSSPPTADTSPDDATEIRLDSSRTPSAQLTTAGTTLGTPAYMSPEQCRGDAVDARSDVYSLGIVAWQALTGRRPFEGNHYELVRQQLDVPAPRADEVNPTVSKTVADVLATALAKGPGERHASAGAMAGSLRVAAEGGSVVLRKAAALYLDRFESFLAISTHASRPALILLVAAFVGLVLSGGGVIAMGVAAMVGGILWSMVTLMTHAVFSVVVERLRSRPLSPIRNDEIFRELNRRVGLDEGAGIWTTTRRVSGFYIAAEMRAPPGLGDLAFQIAFHEGQAPKDVLDRCTLLARVTKKSYDWVRLAILGTILVAPFIEASVLFSFGSFLRLHPADLFMWVVVVTLLSTPLIAMVTNPMLSPALAILYYRARQANGEDIGLSAVIPSRL